MDVATGAMRGLLPKLAELCTEEYKLPKGVTQDIEYLSREMMSFQEALLRLAEVPFDQLHQSVRLSAQEAKEVSYGIDDVVDSFLIGREESKPANLDHDFKGRLEKIANMFKKDKSQVLVLSGAIKHYKFRVMELAERGQRYGLHETDRFSGFVTAVDPRLLALYKDPDDFIGIEESRKDIINKVISRDDCFSNPQLKILSIYGSMGLGKTALAKVVYDQLRNDFSCRAFVPVGRQPDLKNTLGDLLLELNSEVYRNSTSQDERQLIQALRMLLDKNRYLIVLDDIWDIEAWETIRLAFQDQDCGSSVIITTRNFEVAQKAGEVYNMKPLSQQKSHQLFVTRLFGGVAEIPYHIQEVTRSIIEKCDYIPLAIITMASLLVSKPWEKWSLIYKNSIGFGHGDDENAVQETRRTSLFSYYDIPSDVRNCLLHLTTYSHGYMIRKDTLIWKWIAVGFIREEPGVGLFEAGERYFNELINKSLVQPVEIPHSGIIIGCRVNILVLDMICFLSRQENFVTVLDSHNQDTSDLYEARQLAIQNSVVEERFVQNSVHMRSLNFTKCEFQMMPSLTSFQCLRVLALEDCASVGVIYHLEHVRELVQLRYLGLFNTPIYELPEGIESLKFLQTLDLRHTKIEDLPHGIVLLTQLKCFRAGSRSITVPDGMGKLVSLEELQLNDVSSSSNIVQELGKLVMLRDLKLCIKSSDENSKRVLVHSLGNLRRIEILHLDVDSWIEESCWEGYVPSQHLRRVFLGMQFSRLPAWINDSLLPNLSHLSVDVRVVEEEDLLILGSFPGLLSLSLVGEYVSLPDITGGDAFPMLKYCYTSTMIRFLNGAAPRLETVSFNVRLWDSKDGSFDLEFRSLLDHPLLQEVRVEIFYTQTHVTVVEKVEAALIKVKDVHPNSPKIDMTKWKSSVPEQFDSEDDDNCNEYYHNSEEDNDHQYYYDEE